MRVLREYRRSSGSIPSLFGEQEGDLAALPLSLPVALVYPLKGRLVDPQLRASNEYGSTIIPPSSLVSLLGRVPMLVYVRPSNETGLNSSPAFSEAAGVVSTARIERPLLHRGGSASTETMPAASPSPFLGRAFREHRTNVGVLPLFYC
jgi:hypothetical protein